MINEQDKEFIKQFANLLTINEMVEHFNNKYTKKQIKNYCDNHNIRYKKMTFVERSKAIRKVQKKQRRQTLVNHDYFKQWSRNMAYIFGLWCADGYIRNRKNGYCFSIKLHKNDKYLLQQILDEMQSKHKIYDNKDNSCHFVIGSKTIVNDIVNLGGIERKSLTLTFPNVPEEYLVDFIRGYFDGDGSISSNGKSIKIVGTLEFLNDLKIILENKDIHITSVYKNNPKKNSNHYVLCINRKSEILKFCQFIYSSIEDCLYLKRKYEIFKHYYIT